MWLKHSFIIFLAFAPLVNFSIAHGDTEPKAIRECEDFATATPSSEFTEGKMPYVEGKAEGTAKPGMHYKFYGSQHSEKPILVLIPGNGNDMSDYYGILGGLKSQYRLLLIDQPGHGQSDESPQKLPRDSKSGVDDSWMDDYTPATMAESLKHLLDQLKINDKVALLGHSLGARTAVSFFGKYPDRVSKLIIDDMEMSSRDDERPGQTRVKKLKEGLDKGFEKRESLQGAISTLYPKKEEEEMVKRWMKEHTCRTKSNTWRLLIHPWVSACYQYQARKVDLNHSLTAGNAPILLLRAETDSSVSAAGLKAMMDKRPDLLHPAPFPNSTHAIHVSNPIAFVGAVNNFMGTAPPSPNQKVEWKPQGSGHEVDQ